MIEIPRVYSPEVGYVEVPEKPQRIISLSPSVTETLFTLGAGSRIVGVDSWSYRPPEAIKIRRVGSYTTINTDLIVELDPDLILTTTGVQKSLIEKLRELKKPLYPIPVPVSVYEIFNNIIIIGGLIGEYERGLKLAEELLKRLYRMIEEFSTRDRYRVYVEIDLGGPTIPAYYSHITSSLALFGFDNIFREYKQSYLYGFKISDHPLLDLSKVVELDPEIIIYESKYKKPSREELVNIIKSRGWESISAVKNNRYIVIPMDTLAHYGPSYLDNLEFVLKEIKKIL
ncbi:MAG: ABC transporter substrate-binding protein [Sulfolobales archaeon]